MQYLIRCHAYLTLLRWGSAVTSLEHAWLCYDHETLTCLIPPLLRVNMLQSCSLSLPRTLGVLRGHDQLQNITLSTTVHSCTVQHRIQSFGLFWGKIVPVRSVPILHQYNVSSHIIGKDRTDIFIVIDEARQFAPGYVCSCYLPSDQFSCSEVREWVCDRTVWSTHAALIQYYMGHISLYLQLKIQLYRETNWNEQWFNA